EQRNADDHDDYRHQLAERTRQDDIAEAGRGHGGDGEIERVDIAGNAGVTLGEGGIDEAGDHEEEDQEVDHRLDRVAVAAQAALFQRAPDDAGPRQRPEPQDAQETQIEEPGGRQQGDEDEDIHDHRQLPQPAQRMGGGQASRRQVQRQDGGDGIVDPQETRRIAQQRGGDEESDDGEVDDQDRRLEAQGLGRLAVIEQPQPGAQAG